MNVLDRVVLITGASDGIGAACACVFRAAGAKLSLTGRSEEKLAKIAAPDDLVTAADLTERETPELLVNRTIKRFGQIDVLLNNAGEGIYWPVTQSPDRETRAMFNLNFFAPLALIQAAVPFMRQRGSGAIVNVGSIAGRVALPWMPIYSASKFALGAMTESLRMELASYGIQVTLVCPGYVLTDFHAHAKGFNPPERVVNGKRFAIPAERCAQDILRGVERGTRMVVSPRWGRVFIALHQLLPRAVEAHLIQLNQSADRV